ncbi:MAG TPA: 2-hydroxyacid dehydrogenase [Anaerovoracaceae bacterium]|nr:2-hydroxyacid dehydrogenase [Anaerovoracaceae bacterium]
MLDFLYKDELNIVVVGDIRLTPDRIEQALVNSPVKFKNIKKVFWGSTVDEDWFSIKQLNIECNGPEAEAYAKDLDAAVPDADVLISHMCPIPRSLLEKGKNLRAVLSCRGGLENIDVKAACDLGIPVVNVIRNAVSVAEFAVGLILSVTRNIASSHHLIMGGVWERNFPNSDCIPTLEDLKVGLAGLGNIGIELAKRLKALGVPLLAYEPYPDWPRLERNGLGDIEMVPTLEDLFRQSDLISLHLRLTEETRGIIDSKYFSLMKPAAYFMNTARGGLVNQDDLVQALREQRIAGAALDVFDSEPLRKDAGFDGLNNVTLTSHLAGTTFTALANAPVQLLREVDKIVRMDAVERIVNYKQLNL